MDPKDVVIESETGFEDNPRFWPQKLPAGVERDISKFYAHRRVFADGRVVWEFYKRGNTGRSGTETPDPVIATVTETDDKRQKEFLEAQRKAEEAANRAPATRNINGVPHQVVGKDANGQDIWAPVQTTQGPAQQQSSTSSQAAAPGGDPWKDDGPEAGSSGRRWGWNPETRLYDRDLGPSPYAQGQTGAQETANKPDRKQVTGSDGKVYTVVTDPSTNVVTVYAPDGTPAPGNVVPGAAKDDQKPTSASVTEALEGHPGWRVQKRASKDGDGNSVTETVYIDPQGKEHPTPPAKTEKRYTQVTQDKNSRKWYGLTTEGTWEEMEGGPGSNGSAIKGVPPYTPDLTKRGAGIIDRAKELDALVAAGTITWEQRNQVLEQDRVLAQTVASEFNLGVAMLREDYQNQTSQRNVDVNNAQFRANLANTHMTNALSMVEKFAPYLGVEPGRAGGFFRNLMAGQLALATSYGGMKDYPREQMHPNLRNFAERATAGAGGPSQPSMPTPPNAIGAGSVPASITPAQPAAMIPATNTTDAGGVPREFTPSMATNDPNWRTTPIIEDAGPVGQGAQANPRIAQLFGQSMPVPRSPEEDSWRQQAMARRDMLLGERMAGGGLPALPEPVGLDLQSSMGPMLAPVLNTSIQGLTSDMDALARSELEAEWFS